MGTPNAVRQPLIDGESTNRFTNRFSLQVPGMHSRRTIESETMQCLREKKDYKSKRKCEKCTDHLAEMRVNNQKRTSPEYVSINNKTNL